MVSAAAVARIMAWCARIVQLFGMRKPPISGTPMGASRVLAAYPAVRYLLLPLLAAAIPAAKQVYLGKVSNARPPCAVRGGQEQHLPGRWRAFQPLYVERLDIHWSA